MSDIVERLRKTTEQMACTASVEMTLWDKHSNACLEAAAEIDKLRAALKPFADAADDFIAEKPDITRAIVSLGDLRAARAAYMGEKE